MIEENQVYSLPLLGRLERKHRTPRNPVFMNRLEDRIFVHRKRSESAMLVQRVG